MPQFGFPRDAIPGMSTTMARARNQALLRAGILFAHGSERFVHPTQFTDGADGEMKSSVPRPEPSLYGRRRLFGVIED